MEAGQPKVGKGKISAARALPPKTSAQRQIANIFPLPTFGSPASILPYSGAVNSAGYFKGIRLDVYKRQGKLFFRLPVSGRYAV